MKKAKRSTPAAKASKSPAPKKKPIQKVVSKAAPKAASKAAKKPAAKAPKKSAKPAPKKTPPKKTPAKKAAVPAKKAKAAPIKKPAASKPAGKPVKKEVAKSKSAAKQVKTPTSAKIAAPSKPEKKSTVSSQQASKSVVPSKTKVAGEEPRRRGRPAKVVAGQKAPVKGEEGFLGEPDAEALAAVAAETEVKKPAKQPRRRRVRQPPRVPVTLRSRPAWAEAWTALAEAGFDAHTIPAVLRDASLMFIGLGELTPANAEALFHFWEMAEVPAGIESTLEEAFLSQPQQADRKSSLEALFKQALHDGTIQDVLILLGVARHFAEWRDATKRLKVLQSPYAANPDLYSLAREVVG